MEYGLSDSKNLANPNGATSSDPRSEFSKGDVAQKRSKPKTFYGKKTGTFAGGTHGGHLHYLTGVDYLAGTTMNEIKLDFSVHLQPLQNVSFSRIKLNQYAVYVPYSRIWSGSDAYFAQRSDKLRLTSPNIPTFRFPRGITQPNIGDSIVGNPSSTGCCADVSIGELNAQPTRFYNTTLWRNSPSYEIFGNVTDGTSGGTATVAGSSSPSATTYNSLYWRAFWACYNDIFRDKITTGAVPEFTTEEFTAAELKAIMLGNYFFPLYQYTNGDSPSWRFYAYSGYGAQDSNINSSTYYSYYSSPRVASEINYLTNFRGEVVSNNNAVTLTSLFTHVVTQAQMDEYRSRSSDVQMTDEEVIAKIRGSRVAREDIPYIIGQKTTDIDLSVQPQTTDGSLPLGADGAYSYTFASTDLLSGYFSAPRDGIVMVLYTITSPDSINFVDQLNLELAKTQATDYYRPALAKIKDKELKIGEVNLYYSRLASNDTIGFKRRYSEYTRMPNYIRGDVPRSQNSGITGSRNSQLGFLYSTYGNPSSNRVAPYYGAVPSRANWCLLKDIGELFYDSQNRGNLVVRQRQDFTDMTMRNVLLNNGGSNTTDDFILQSPQTFFLYGTCTIGENAPIDEDIKTNYINWGEE